jgi:mono/diheme cytochrome c family protein
VLSRDRLLAFRLGGDAALPPSASAAPERAPEPPPAATASAAELALGRRIFNQRCIVCHGVNAVGVGMAPDLRRAPAATWAAWDAIVRYGARAGLGMPGFGTLLTQAEVDATRAYVALRARALARAR